MLVLLLVTLWALTAEAAEDWKASKCIYVYVNVYMCVLCDGFMCECTYMYISVSCECVSLYIFVYEFIYVYIC